MLTVLQGTPLLHESRLSMWQFMPNLIYYELIVFAVVYHEAGPSTCEIGRRFKTQALAVYR